MACQLAHLPDYFEQSYTIPKKDGAITSMNMLLNCVASVLVLCSVSLVAAHSHHHDPSYHAFAEEIPIMGEESVQAEDRIPSSTRAHWMRRAIQALADLESPCLYQAFGAAIVNHTSPVSELGELVCIGANDIAGTGNPTLHGEVAAINNCSTILTDPEGPYKLSPSEAMAAWSDLTLYTTAEPCPMCATAIRWGGFKECVYGTGSPTLEMLGWSQIPLRTQYVFDESSHLGRPTLLLGKVLANETDPLFHWQEHPSYPCPNGCQRKGETGLCAPE